MESSPTRGAADRSGWKSSRWSARAVRVVAFAFPPLVGWLAVHLGADYLIRPPGKLGLIEWALQATIVSAAVCLVVERFTRRLLPLAFLLNLSLVFPDQAPSRFSLALRAGSTKNLRKRALELHQTDDANDVACAALELVTALSSHDRRTRGHSERVRAYCDVIATRMGLSADDRHLLAWGALLHDIGKLSVPAEVLNKKSKLTGAEWKLLQGHPGAGTAMLAGLAPWLGDWLRAADQHHERWDGGGYPSGLAGNEISLAGRITAVADAYDVITSKRSYKDALSTDAARAELVRCAGTQFDPDVVRSFLEVSLGSHRPTGAFASLLELRSLTSVGTHVSSGVLAGSAVAAATVASISGGVPHSVESLAFVDGIQIEAAVDDQQPSVSLTLVPAVSPDGSDKPSIETGAELEQATSVVSSLPDVSTSPSTTAFSPTTRGTATSPATTSEDIDSASTSTPGPPATQAPSTSQATTTAAAQTTTQSTTTTPAGPLILYLANSGSGNTASSNPLSMTLTAPSLSALPNYDTDRDSFPGLVLAKDGAGLGVNDNTKFQEWDWVVPADRTLQGTIAIRLWIGAKDANEGEDVGVLVRLQLCDPGCTTLGTDAWAATSTSSQGMIADLDLGMVASTAPAGSTLRLKVVVPDSLASTEVILSYDTSIYPAFLHIS